MLDFCVWDYSVVYCVVFSLFTGQYLKTFFGNRYKTWKLRYFDSTDSKLYTVAYSIQFINL